MTQKAKSSIFIVIVSAVLLAIIGCSTGDNKPSEKTEHISTSPVEVKDTEPTPSPTPTPVIDMEEGTYDISEMPLFAIEGTDYVPVAFELEKLGSETADGEPVIIEETGEEEADAESEDAEEAAASEEEGSEEDSEETEPVKIYNKYRITLKSGLKFKDGTPVTAEDVMFNIRAHANKAYDGSYKLGFLDIPGMEEFRTQVPNAEREKVAKILAAGGFDVEEGKYPEIEGIDTAEQDAVWGCYDEAGVIFARNIIDYVNKNYALNAYVNAFMSGYLTYAKVEASESLKTAFAYIVWGYGKKKNPYNYRKNTLTTISDKVFDLNEYELTAMDLWEEIKGYYKGDLSDEGIDNDAVPGTGTIEELIAEVYFGKQDYKVEDIAGISTGTTIAEGSDAERECIYLTLSAENDITEFNFFLTSPGEFEKTSALNDPEVIIEVGEEETEGEGSEEGENPESEDSEGGEEA